MITMDKIYRTRNGRKVRVLAVDIKHPIRPVLAAIEIEDGTEIAGAYLAGGQYLTLATPSPGDLIEYNPAKDLVLDRPIWVHTRNGWKPRHFSHLQDGVACCFDDGKTSHSSDGHKTPWAEWTATNPKDAS